MGLTALLAAVVVHEVPERLVYDEFVSCCRDVKRCPWWYERPLRVYQEPLVGGEFRRVGT